MSRGIPVCDVHLHSISCPDETYPLEGAPTKNSINPRQGKTNTVIKGEKAKLKMMKTK